MLYSEFYISTEKENLSTANTKSYNLMFRASVIKKMGSSYYTFLPLGETVLRKTINIMEKTLKRNGYLGVFNGFDNETFLYTALKDRINKTSDLPLNITALKETKRKNNIKSGYGLLFNSLTLTQKIETLTADLTQARDVFNETVLIIKEILSKLSINYRPVQTGEDKAEILAFLNEGDRKFFLCDSCNYAASSDFILPYFHKGLLISDKKMEKVYTPDMKTIKDLSEFFSLSEDNFIKSVFFDVNGKKILAITRGDRKISLDKLKKIFDTDKVKQEDSRYVERVLALPVGFIGPVGLEHIFIVADYSVKSLKNAVTGANEKDYHYKNVNPGRDFNVDMIADITQCRGGDICPICKQGKLYVGSGVTLVDMEIKKDKADIKFKNENASLFFSVFNIDINRLLAIVVHQNSDDKGIIWPLSIAPFKLILILIKNTKNNLDKAKEFENELGAENVLIDDRNKGVGTKFADSELLGIPYRVVISEKALKNNSYEFTERRTLEKKSMSYDEIIDYVKKGEI